MIGSNFGATCPFTVNWLPGADTSGGIPDTTRLITAGLFIGKPPTTSFGSGLVNFALAGSHPMLACRCYYSLIKLSSAKEQSYLEENRAKSVVYENVIMNQYNGIPASGTFSQLVQSGIKNPLAICMIPMISGTTPQLVGGTTTIGLSQFQSCFDTFPATYSPIS